MTRSFLRKSIAGLAVASALALAAVPAEAGWRHGYRGNAGGAAIAAGIFGLAAGAIIASQANRAHAAPAYGYGQSYAPAYAPAYSQGYEAYGDDDVQYQPQCYVKNKPVWDAYQGWVWRDIQVCR